ncbi:hypothetical protein AB0J55_17670 [Amycolatopsis sp. NPDC049688]|uniref:hypothetical protein n=1 Tax=Amycolatopsis sp. NPDC049688 TaxID=3154733 RepID=UPI0034157B59
MDLWHEAYDSLNKAEGAFAAKGIEPDLDQLLKIAEVKALLAVGQELSKIHHEGVNPDYSAGG